MSPSFPGPFSPPNCPAARLERAEMSTTRLVPGRREGRRNPARSPATRQEQFAFSPAGSPRRPAQAREGMAAAGHPRIPDLPLYISKQAVYGFLGQIRPEAMSLNTSCLHKFHRVPGANSRGAKMQDSPIMLLKTNVSKMSEGASPAILFKTLVVIGRLPLYR